MKRFDSTNFQRLYWQLGTTWGNMAEIMDCSMHTCREIGISKRGMSVDFAIRLKHLSGITLDDLYLRELTDDEIKTASINYRANTRMRMDTVNEKDA